MEAGALTASERGTPPRSLRERIISRYAQAAVAGEQPLTLDELLGYLAAVDRFELKPLAAVLLQTDAIGDPAVPTPEQVAVLEWLGDAFEYWQREFPLEQPLAGRLRQLLPLAAALAVSDPRFLIIGEHPLHRLLDHIQDYAIGWQPSLGRAGNTLERQVETAVEQARGWFTRRGTDLQHICDEVAATAERDRSRAERMTQRAMETEQGRLRAAEARYTAAQMINEGLARYRLPPVIGQFLKGPWYDSAQLVLLKFGVDSEQWRELSATTETLLDSLQVDGPQGDKRRQYLFETVTHIPRELKRWLLTLQHDADAANDAVQPIEFSHLRILRGLELELQSVDPLPLEKPQGSAPGAVPEAIGQLQPGQWFRVEEESGRVLRARLSLVLEEGQQLLFANQAGMKTLQLSYTEFNALLAERRAVPLRGGASFRTALAHAAGIDPAAELALLVREAVEQAVRDADATAQQPQVNTPAAGEQAAEPATAHTPAQAPGDASPEESDPASGELPADAARAPLTGTESGAQPGAGTAVPEDTGPGTEGPAAAAAEPALPVEPAAELTLLQAAEQLARETGAAAPPPADDIAELIEDDRRRREDLERGQREREAAEASAREEARRREEDERARLQQERERTERDDAGRREREEREQRERWEALAREREEAERREREARERATQEQALEGPDFPPDETDLELQMGAWLGFHDGEAPLMAKLAVHDPEQDLYIFVNRRGIKMRQLSGRELRSLMARGLVDILVTRSEFRTQVTRAREDGEAE